MRLLGEANWYPPRGRRWRPTMTHDEQPGRPAVGAPTIPAQADGRREEVPQLVATD